MPAFVITGLALGSVFAAELIGTTKKVQRNAAGMGGKTSSGTAKKIKTTAGQGTMSTSVGTSKRSKKGYQNIRYYPATILDLSAQAGAAFGTATLTWTAPGADGTRGRAAKYRVAYSKYPINNEDDFIAASAYAQSMTPLAAGSTETLSLSGLPPGETVYFAVKAVEPGGNQGRLSNVPSALIVAPAGVSGAVSYYGSQGGRIVVAAYDSTPIFTTANMLVSTQIAASGAYGLEGIQPGTTFYVAGFVDMNQDLAASDGEDYGFYGGASPVALNLGSGQTAYEAYFEILTASTSDEGLIAGDLHYGGAQSGAARIELFTTPAFTGQPAAAVSTAPAGAFSFLVPGDVGYYLRAYIDRNANAAYDSGEAYGLYAPNNEGAEQVYVPRQTSVSGADIYIYDPGCTAAGCAGLGTASASVASVTAGSQASFNIYAIVGASGRQLGGLAGFGVPYGWGALQNTCPSCGGYVSVTAVSTNTVTVELDADPYSGTIEPLSGQYSATARITDGSLNPGDTVQFAVSGLPVPCQPQVSTFTVTSAQRAGLTAVPLLAGSPAVSVVSGGAVTLSFSQPALTLTQYTTSHSLGLSGKDYCGAAADVSAPAGASLSGRTYNYTTGLFDADASLRLSNSYLAGFATPKAVAFGAGQSSATLYALASSTGSKYIQAAYDLGAGARYAYCAVNVLQGNPFSAVNVSSGAFTSGRSSMTITPDGDGASDSAFINFTLADQALSWRVQIASASFDTGAAAVWQAFGTGSAWPGRVAWDGAHNIGANSGRGVPNGAYYVRVTAGNATDDTLRVAVMVNQLSGQVTDPSFTPAVPVPDVKVQAYGPVSRGVLTDAAGRFLLPGVSVGTYTVTFWKSQYLAVSTRAVVASTSTVLNVALQRAPVLEVIPVLQAGATQPYEQWGELQVYTTGWAKNLLQPIRLQAGTTTFDDGGQWDASLQQFVTRTRFRFEVTQDTYTVAARLTGYFPVSSSAYVGPAGLALTLPPLNRRVNIAGLVTLSTAANSNPNPSGLTASVIAVSGGLARASALVSLPVGVTTAAYTLTGIEPGTYTVRGFAQGFESVSSGPVAVGALDLNSFDLPSFREGGLLTGTVTVSGDTSGFTALAGSAYPLSVGITAWSQQTAAQGKTTVYLSSSAVSSAAQYQITGLKPGATYQVFADLSFNADAAFQSPGGFPKTVFISSAAQSATLNFSFEKASGAVAALMRLPNPVDEVGAPNPDFTLASLKWRITRSDDPLRVGRVYELSSSTGLPGFLCAGTTASTGTAPGCAAGVSSATFRLAGLRTETIELTMAYQPTGRTAVVNVAVVNGSTVTTTLDLRGETYAIAGRIINQISEPLFNTNALIVQNAPYDAPAGYPSHISSTTARVEAIRRAYGELLTQVSTTTFDAAKTRVGLLTSAGTYAITGIQSGVYLVRTLPLRAGATGAVLVPSKEQLVAVTASSRTGMDFTLSDGFTVSGRVALDQGLSDARNLRLTLKNRRGETVNTLDLPLGNPGAGVAANSADYSFARVPLGGFYTLEVRDLGTPVKYIGRPLTFPDRAASPDGLQGEVSGVELLLKRAATIIGKLRDANSDSLITEANAALLAPNFRIYAIANPWVDGGFVLAQSSVAGRPIEADGTFRIEPLAPGVPYDVHLEQETWDMAFMNAGSQNYTPAVNAQNTLSAGQVKDIGIVDLNQGQSITGAVADQAGEPLPNITMTAVPALVSNPATVFTQTGSDGAYTLWVSTFISQYFDLTAAAREENLQTEEGASLYAPKTLRVDLTKSSVANFTLAPLLGRVTGQVLTADGGPFSYPFGGQKGFPAAAVFMQLNGTIPKLHPLGDIAAMSQTDGTFEVPGLSTGSYTLRAASLGYIVWTSSVVVTTAPVSAGTLTLTRGASVTGSIRKADQDSPTGWSCPNSQEVTGIAAAADDFSEFVTGTVEESADAQTVCAYDLSGFKTGQDYQVALLGDSEEDIVFPYEGAVSFGVLESAGSKSLTLTYRTPVPECLPTFKYLGNNQIKLTFRCNKALRNETGLDNDLEYILARTTYTSAGANLVPPDGTGQFLGSDKKLAQGRKDLTAIYRPAANETRFTVRLRAYTAAHDPSTGASYLIDQLYDFYTGVDASKKKKINNMQGGQFDMESGSGGSSGPNAVKTAKAALPYAADDAGIENTSVSLPPGAFVQDGATEPSPDTTVDVGMNKGRTREQVAAQALSMGVRISAKEAGRLASPRAYPAGMSAAMQALKAGRVKDVRPSASGTAVATPFSAFYDIFLPLGIKRELKNKARLKLSYDASMSTSTALTNLNIWYFNTATHMFELEEDGKEIDTANNTVSALVDHFSVFVVLASTPLYTSTSPYAGAELEVFNFPNPFNLAAKTRTLNLNAGGGTYTAGNVQITTRGTVIRAGVPRGVAGQGKLKIYTLAGELVREYDCGYVDGSAGVSGSGTWYYFEWDGRNSYGREVASDIYIGEFKVGGRKKFWKMAVVKDPKYN